MKKSLLMLLCATSMVLGATAVSAQDAKLDRPMPPRHEKMRDHLGKKLNLTEEQEAKAKALREDGFKKMKPLMEEMKTLREKMDQLRKDDMKAFEEILTPEQKAEFDKIKAERKPRHDKGFKKGKFGKDSRRGPRHGDLDHEVPVHDQMSPDAPALVPATLND